jgi:hypothetical protein
VQGPAQEQQLGAAAQGKNNHATKIGEQEKKTGGAGGGVSAATAARALALAAEIGALGLIAFAVYEGSITGP